MSVKQQNIMYKKLAKIFIAFVLLCSFTQKVKAQADDEDNHYKGLLAKGILAKIIYRS